MLYVLFYFILRAKVESIVTKKKPFSIDLTLNCDIFLTVIKSMTTLNLPDFHDIFRNVFNYFFK